MRRRALLAERWPDLETVELRGNVDTRLRKVEDGEVDAAILAAAGLQRLSVAESAAATLDPDRWVPAPGQGALAIETLESRSDLRALFAELDDESAATELAAERAFAHTLEGGCTIPLGCLARVDGDHLVVTGFLGHPDGGSAFRDRVSGRPVDAEDLGRELARSILDAGGDELIDELRELPAASLQPP